MKAGVLLGKKPKEHVYKAVTYEMGVVVKEFITTDIHKVRKEYQESMAMNRSVRIYIDGRKLKYSESNSMFVSGIVEFYYGKQLSEGADRGSRERQGNEEQTC